MALRVEGYQEEGDKGVHGVSSPALDSDGHTVQGMVCRLPTKGNQTHLVAFSPQCIALAWH